VKLRACIFLLSAAAAGQVPPHTASPQVKKEWEVGNRSARDLEKRDGRITDAGVSAYLQNLEKTIAAAAGLDAPEIRLTRGMDWYASRTAGGVLYVSAALLMRIETEGEMAGLLAHDLAHTRHGDRCVLASSLAPGPAETRDAESRATATAIAYLRAAGYDPTGVLDLMSKLANEHPAWAMAIVAEDLLAVRATIEAENPPRAGWRIDSSGFQKARARANAELDRARNAVTDKDVNQPRHFRK